MKLYLLDTCTISDFFSGAELTQQRLHAASPAQIAISAITVMEVLYGFQLNAKAQRKLSGAFHSLCAAIQIIGFDNAVAEVTARVRAELKDKGTPVGPWDLLIAGTALAHERILVTSNMREFARIEGLTVENWRAKSK